MNDIDLPKNQSLCKARGAKQDEFYTQLGDIELELKHYKDQLRGKTIFCNCDDPFESNFVLYFILNFNELGLKRLIATSYRESLVAGSQLSLFPEPEAYAIEVTEVPNGEIDLDDVKRIVKKNARRLYGEDAGDFRSRECVALLKQSDVVITNPPFSLFREFIAQLVEHDKQFLIIGNTNAITYKGIFALIMEDRFRTGNTKFNVGMFFAVPHDWEHYHHIDPTTGRKIARVSTSCWFTNLDVAKHHEFIPLYKKYTIEEYPQYDNYDAINVSKVAEIPVDYYGVMGVPITFLDKFNSEQFELLGSNRDVGQDPNGVYGRGSMLHGKETFKRLFIKKRG